MNIYQAMAAIMNDIEAIGKNKKNAQQGYTFRGIDDMYNFIHPLFKKHGVFITSNVIESKREERQTQKGGALIYTIVKCQFSFYATDGSSVSSTVEGEAMDSGDKSTNKALSAALKYALMQMFLIPTEEKLDTEYETHEVKAKEKKQEARIEETFTEVDALVRQKYDKEEDLLMVLDTIETLAQIKNLYHFNQHLVNEQHKHILSQFKSKKNELTSTAA